MSFLATATIVLASLLIPTTGAHAAPQSPTIQAETTAEGHLSISLTDATVSLTDGNLIYRDLTGAVIENESTVGFVESGGTISVVTPTQVVLTAPPVENATPSMSLRSGQPFTGSWDECMSGYIAGGGIGGLVAGPGGIFAGMLVGAAAAFAACNGLPRM